MLCAGNDDMVCEVPHIVSEGKIQETCASCRNEGACVVIKTDEPFCRNCFNEYFRHKFRTTVSKSKLLSNGDSILIGFSGGMCSSVLMHLTKQLKQPHGTNKRMLDISCVAVFLDDKMLLEYDSNYFVSEENKQKKLKRMRGLTDKTNIKLLVVPIEAVLNTESVFGDCSEQKIYIGNIYTHCADPEMKVNLIRLFRRILLLRVAKEVGCNKVLLGETNSHVCTQLLTSLCHGISRDIAELSQPVTDVGNGIEIIRPLHDLPIYQIAVYARLNGLLLPYVPDAVWSLQKQRTEISDICSLFIKHLQSSNSSTESTISKMIKKLSVRKSPVRCCICNTQFFDSHKQTCSSLLVCDQCFALYQAMQNESFFQKLKEINKLNF